MQLSISQAFFDVVSTWWFYIVFAAAWVLPTLFVIQLITPAHIVERYFKRPHFNFGETVVLSHFPGSLLRTLILMCGCIFERYRVGRKLHDYLSVAPRWFVVVSGIYVSAIFVHTFLIFGLMGFLLLCEIEP